MENGRLTRCLAPFALAAFLASPAAAQCVPEAQFAGPRGGAWNHNPDVVVIGSKNDMRAPLVEDAVRFWNGELERLGVGLRLGSVTYRDRVPELDAYSVELGEAVLRRERPPRAPRAAGLRALCGHIVVVLAERQFVSFARAMPRLGIAYVGLKSGTEFPFTLYNVARNVIAHELGHAIGLRHNSEDSTLMCGRPAGCGPRRFESSRDVYFPLSGAEEGWIRRNYGG